MAIKSVQLKNFLGFSDKASFDFSNEINVIIGENGSGKTTILKCIYAAIQCSNPDANFEPMAKTAHYFSYDIYLSDLASGDKECGFTVRDDNNYFMTLISRNQTIAAGASGNLDVKQAVFIPTTEMLSHSKGLLALNQKYKLPFDDTQIDIIVNASLPEIREIPSNVEGILEKISKAIDGTVVMEDDTFYVVKSDGKKIEFSLEAEGLRKLGLIWKLIRNGLLEEGSVLLWDEPEANLNPELYPLVADILIELQKNGVQIFVATHSYNFAKYLEIKSYYGKKALFFTLYKDSDGVIKSDVSTELEESKNNPMVKAENTLLDTILD